MLILLVLVALLFAQFTVLNGYKIQLVEFLQFQNFNDHNSELISNVVWNILAISPISIWLGATIFG